VHIFGIFFVEPQHVTLWKQKNSEGRRYYRRHCAWFLVFAVITQRLLYLEI